MIFLGSVSTALAISCCVRVLPVCALLMIGCAHGSFNGEEAVDADARNANADEQLVQGLLRLDWRSAGGELNQARDESLSEGKRLTAYQRAIIVLQAMSDRYAVELVRHPDIAYSPRAGQLEAAQRRCADQLVQVKKERIRFEATMHDDDESPSQQVVEPAPKPKPKPAPVKLAAHGGKKTHYAKANAKPRRHFVVANAG